MPNDDTHAMVAKCFHDFALVLEARGQPTRGHAMRDASRNEELIARLCAILDGAQPGRREMGS